MTPPPETQRTRAGQLIGDKYRLVRRIDEGGMGTVWEAENVALDVSVAVKLIRSELTGSGAAERLAHEARILARLDHPAIVRVLDCGESGEGAPFVVMELLKGECLADTLDREGTLTAERVVSFLLPIADAVHSAHVDGIVHRDLKPENIYLAETTAGRIQPKVLDFGIARSAVSRSLRLTTDGSLLGSPQYMSPEQARGQGDIDGRTDVWALSVVLYECLAGKCPFAGENYNATLRMIIEDEPPSLEGLGLADALLSSIVERGLRKDRELRWSSMRELGVALAQWLYGQGVGVDATGLALRSRWLETAAGSIPPVSFPSVPPPGPLPAPPDVGREATPVESQPRISTIGLSRTYEPPPRRRGGVAAVAAVVLALGLVAAFVARSGLGEDARSAPAAQGPAPAVTAALGVTPLELAEPAAPPVATPTADAASGMTHRAKAPETDEAAPPARVAPAARSSTQRKLPKSRPSGSRSRAKRELKDPY